MSSSGLDWEKKRGASGEGNQGKGMQEEREHEGCSERRRTEGQLLSPFTAIMLICPLFFFLKHLHTKPHVEKLYFSFSAVDAACFDLCTTGGWLTLCKGRRCT